VWTAVHVVTKRTRRVIEGDYYTTTKGLHTKTLKREKFRKFIYEVDRFSLQNLILELLYVEGAIVTSSLPR